MPFQSHLRVAAVQHEVTGGLSLDGFLTKIDASLAEAQAQGAELAVFPELFCSDLLESGAHQAAFEARERAQWERIARDDSARYFSAVQSMSRARGLAVLAGTFPRYRNSEDIVNTALLALPDGTTHWQDKVFVTAYERLNWRWKDGGGGVTAFDAPWGRTVMPICYDVEFPAITNRLVGEKPELWLVPSCTEAVHGFNRVRWCAQARAVEHHAYVLHVGTVGTGHYGQAGFFTPCEDGFPHVLAESPLNRPSVTVATFDLEKLRRSRETARAYPARDQLHRGGGLR